MDFLKLFREQGTHLFWKRLPDDHIVDGSSGQPIEQDQAYFVIRLNEMFLGRSRTLWRKFYPMVHAFNDYAGREEHAVVGPGQLQDLTESNLDRVINLNNRLSGPTAFKGGEVQVLIGLYSVPGDDVAKALVATVGSVAGLAGASAAPVAQVVEIVKAGVDNLLGLQETTLRLGIRDTFYPSNPLRSGYHIGIGAPEADVNMGQLWLREGRLVQGADPIMAKPYTEYDYMLLQIERRDRREDWPSLPGMAEHEKRFATVLTDTSLSVPEKRAKLGTLWPPFTEALRTSRHLTTNDATLIAENVSKDLNERLRAMEEGNPFETKAWGTEAVEARDPAALDFAEIPDYVDPNAPRSAAALSGNPF